MTRSQFSASKFSLKLLLMALLMFVGARIYYRATDDFRISNISYSMTPRPEWNIAPLTQNEQETLNQIFSQEFTYIGKGAQSYAFVSNDDQYVIKFFKFKHLKPSWFINSLPAVWPLKQFKETQQYKKNRKLLSVFNGYRLSYELHRPETGLLYIHLNNSDDLNKTVVVKDKIGMKRTIHLDEVNFVVQRKVETSRKVIFGDLARNDLNKAKAHIRSLLDLYRSEYAKGIYDHDHGVMHNTGFAGDQPIHLDVGKMYRDENIHKKEYALQDLTIVAKKIAARIQEEFPKFYEDILSDINSYFIHAYGDPFQP